MNIYETKGIEALRKRFALELMTSGNSEIKQTPIPISELQLLLLSHVSAHPGTAYAVRDFLIRQEIVIVNRARHIAIVNLEKLREVKE